MIFYFSRMVNFSTVDSGQIWVRKVMITENGLQFTSRAFERFLGELGCAIHRRRSEDMGRELPGAAAAVNTSLAETTGYSPAFIAQGSKPSLPNALFDDQTTGTGVNRRLQRTRRIGEDL